jgi:hypothetical protein
MTVLLAANGAAARYSGGTGKPNDPYRIATAADLNDIGNHAEDFNKCFVMINDINLADYTGTRFNIIGRNSATPFTGVFDGNGRAVFNFSYSASNETRAGLFATIGGGIIKDLRLIAPDIKAPECDYVGALVGSAYVGRIEHCCVLEGEVSANSSVGGLAGYNNGLIIDCNTTCAVMGTSENTGGLTGVNRGHIVKCSTYGSVSGAGNTGGLVGLNDDPLGSIADSSATGAVNGTYAVGGLVGRNSPWSVIAACHAAGDVNGYEGSIFLHDGFGGLVGSNSGYILNSYATGSVRGESEVGGLVGSHYWGFDSYRTVENCYSTGPVWGVGLLGGLVGFDSGNYPGIVLNSFWDVQTSNKDASAGGTGLATEQMQNVNTFLNAGWDFFDETLNGNRDVWAQLPGGGYMALWYDAPNQPPVPFTAGQGTPSHPYLISSPAHLLRITDNPRYMNAHFQLTADIDLGVSDVNSIGSSYRPFCGAFIGGNHTVANLTLSSSSLPYTGHEVFCAGLFSRLGCGGSIENVGIIDANIINAYFGGGLVGHNLNGTIRNSYSTGSIAGYNYLGGLVGNNVSGCVLNCHAHADVNGIDFVGGLAGSSSGMFGTASISNCSASGNVRAEMSVGGIVGENTFNAAIDRSYAAGDVVSEAWYYVGGLVGISKYGSITDCYALGDVIGLEKVGGLIGHNWRSETYHCYAAGSIWADAYLGGLTGSDNDSTYTKSFWNTTANPGIPGIGNKVDPNVIGESGANMQIRSTFADAGWDFVGEVANGTEDIWRMCVDGVSYPLLSWEFTKGDLLCPDGVDFVDYSDLANRWQEVDCAAMNNCDRADLDFSGAIDWKDLKIFCDHWLEGTAY